MKIFSFEIYEALSKKKLLNLLVLLVLSLTLSLGGQASLIQDNDSSFRDIPKTYPLFTVNYQGEEIEPSCYSQDFKGNCMPKDQICKTRKGLCGEFLSHNFFQSETDWEPLVGLYEGNKGFDGFYKLNPHKYTRARYVVIEDKAGHTANLTYNTQQMSLGWLSDRAKDNLVKVPSYFANSESPRYLTVQEAEEFQYFLRNGQVINFFTRTLYKDNRTPSKDLNSLGYYNLISIPPGNRNIQAGSGTYTFRTEISLLGNPNWPSGFKTAYLGNYQLDIHVPIFNNSLSNRNCPFFDSNASASYCIDSNSLNSSIEKGNYSVLSSVQASNITFH